MPYIGAQPTTAAFITDTFNGNGSTTAFTMSAAPANTNSILVAISGVLQDPSTYSVSGTTLTFSAAPPSGTGNISVRFLGIPASGVVTTAYRTQTEFTATAGQTTFSVPSYTVGYIDVYRNGVLLGSADFTATNGTTVVLAAGASAGDLIETVSFYVSSVVNAIPAVAGAVNDTYLNTGAVTTTKIANANVTQAKLASGVAGNGPTFSAIQNASSSLSAGATTKVNFQLEQWDTNNNYDTSTSRFTPTVAGYYQISSTVRADISGNAILHIYFRKNGVEEYAGGFLATASNQTATTGSCLLYLNGSTDYVEIAVFSATAGNTIGTYQASFQGCLVRSA